MYPRPKECHERIVEIRAQVTTLKKHREEINNKIDDLEEEHDVLRKIVGLANKLNVRT